MFVTRIQLKNWKNFREVDVGLGRRTFIIGPNASGKSNFLDAFRFLRDVSEWGLKQSVEERGGISRLRCLSAKRPDFNVSICVILDSEWKYEISFHGKGKEDAKIVSENVWNSTARNENWDVVLSRPDEDDIRDPARLTQTALEQVNTNKDFREIPNFFKTITYRHILPQAVRDAKGFSPIPLRNDPFGRDFVFQIWNTTPKTRTSRLEKISKVLKLVIPFLEALDVQMDKATGIPHIIARYTNWRARGVTQDESSLSDGTLRLLALLWSLFERSGPLLLEEPELSLHDEAVRQLPAMFDAIGRAKQTRMRQIILSTHSEAMLSDEGIGPYEVLRLDPSKDGTVAYVASQSDAELMKSEGLTAADVILPKSKPQGINQLSLLDL